MRRHYSYDCLSGRIHSHAKYTIKVTYRKAPLVTIPPLVSAVPLGPTVSLMSMEPSSIIDSELPDIGIKPLSTDTYTNTVDRAPNATV